jgi:hypothetical protein
MTMTPTPAQRMGEITSAKKKAERLRTMGKVRERIG